MERWDVSQIMRGQPTFKNSKINLLCSQTNCISIFDFVVVSGACSFPLFRDKTILTENLLGGKRRETLVRMPPLNALNVFIYPLHLSMLRVSSTFSYTFNLTFFCTATPSAWQLPTEKALPSFQKHPSLWVHPSSQVHPSSRVWWAFFQWVFLQDFFTSSLLSPWPLGQSQPALAANRCGDPSSAFGPCAWPRAAPRWSQPQRLALNNNWKPKGFKKKISIFALVYSSEILIVKSSNISTIPMKSKEIKKLENCNPKYEDESLELILNDTHKMNTPWMGLPTVNLYPQSSLWGGCLTRGSI